MTQVEEKCPRCKQMTFQLKGRDWKCTNCNYQDREPESNIVELYDFYRENKEIIQL